MKTPAFWYERGAGHWLARLLSPFSSVWTRAAMARAVGVAPFRPYVPMICVGNIVAGGAGKTPVAIALARHLIAQGHRPVFVTRGYGGAITVPSRVIRALHTAADVGDEAMLLAEVAPTYVGRDRVSACILAQHVATHIIMDDGLQNPYVEPWLRLLVVDALSGFGNGRIIPAGPLREPVHAALQRVDAVIITQSERDTWRSGLLDQLRQCDAPLLRGIMRPSLPPDFPQKARFFAFAGIGHPEKFFATCRWLQLDVVETMAFADHHPYSDHELHDLQKKADVWGARLVTTQKDLVRLSPEWQNKVLTLPVTVEIEGIETVLGRVIP